MLSWNAAVAAAAAAVRRRPVLWTVAAGTSVCVGTVVAVEGYTLALTAIYNKNNQNNESMDSFSHTSNTSTITSSTGSSSIVQLPRLYSAEAIQTYWSYRPVTTTLRMVEIATQLLPLAWAYLRDFGYSKSTSSTALSSNSQIVPILSSPMNEEGQNEQQKQQDDVAHDSDKVLFALYKKHAIMWRQALTALGPAFVKAGQQVSIRPDLVPAVVLTELQQLCDAVPPVPDAIALESLRQELNVPDILNVFVDVPVLVASASLGQVYQARLRHEPHQPQVAVKVQRPDMLSKFSLDLYFLQRIGQAVDMFTSVFTNQPPFHTALYDSFASGSYAELDYEQEAAHQTLFRRELAARNCPVVIPKVYYRMQEQQAHQQQYSTRRVLISEWMDGIRLVDAPLETVRELIPIGVELFLTQLLDIGQFHADPHVGNLLVLRDSGKLCLLDFGLVATISQKDRDAMTAAMIHLLQRDFEALVHHDSKALGFLPESFDTTELLPLLTKILTVGMFMDDSSSSFSILRRQRHRKLMEISSELNEIFFAYPFSVPPFFALVTRGLGLLEGIALSGDENFDIFQAAAPYARRRAMQVLLPPKKESILGQSNPTTVATTVVSK